MKRVHLCAAVNVRVRVSVDTCAVISGAIPSVTVVSGDNGVCVDRVVDDEVQGVHLRAAIRIRMAVSVGSRSVINSSVPGECLTNCICYGDMLRIVDVEVQDGYGVAASRCLCGVGVGARDVKVVRAEVVGAAVTDARGDGVAQVVVDVEV